HLAPTETYTLSLHDALPILAKIAAQTWVDRSSPGPACDRSARPEPRGHGFLPEFPISVPAGFPHFRTDLQMLRPDSRSSRARYRSEEHTSELQSRENLVCRL